MLLNGASLNGVTLNGGSLVVLEGVAAFDASADLAAAGTVTSFASSAASCAGELLADATRKVAPDAVFQCTGELIATGTHRQAGGASPNGSAELVAYILTVVEASAGFACSAELLGIAAGAFGSAAFDASGDLSADATRIVNGGTATAACTGDLAVSSGGPVVYRRVSAAISGTASLTAAYEVDNGPTVTHYVGATFESTGELEVDTDLVFFNKDVLFDCTAGLTCTAKQTQFGEADASGTAAISATLTSTAYGVASAAGSGEMSATAVRTQLPTADVGASGEVAAAAFVTQTVAATVVAGAEVSVSAVGLLPMEAHITGSAEIIPLPVRTAFSSVAFAASGDLTAEARTNVEADDPLERTMYRPGVDREMRRPFVDRIMREAA